MVNQEHKLKQQRYSLLFRKFLNQEKKNKLQYAEFSASVNYYKALKHNNTIKLNALRTKLDKLNISENYDNQQYRNLERKIDIVFKANTIAKEWIESFNSAKLRAYSGIKDFKDAKAEWKSLSQSDYKSRDKWIYRMGLQTL